MLKVSQASQYLISEMDAVHSTFISSAQVTPQDFAVKPLREEVQEAQQATPFLFSILGPLVDVNFDNAAATEGYNMDGTDSDEYHGQYDERADESAAPSSEEEEGAISASDGGQAAEGQMLGGEEPSGALRNVYFGHASKRVRGEEQRKQLRRLVVGGYLVRPP